ncbi:MAG: sigma-54-dependent Fis family transcriptional regulator [Acidobacteria bacterium]|nr:sigma-54-dependent Fis family transcriptional regulator [Acidobacteriota bacterium]
MNVCHRKQYVDMEVVYASPATHKLLQQAEQVASTDATVLITGESGSGKEMVARAIHHHSRRRSRSWVDINCTALPENLLESELFGYEKGAFSGADQPKQGLFELANHGTLFLDEIGDFDVRLQVKLLRILDGAPFFRLGGVRKVQTDTRLVTATNQDLKTACAQGRFRADLYHRLSQVRLRVPPLRERPEDIAPLARHFLEKQRADLEISPQALRILQEYPWPGNVRELRNVVTGAAVFAAGKRIQVEDLPEELRQASFTTDLHNLSVLGEAERSAISRVLEEAGGRQLQAAEMLGISRRTLQRRIKAYGLKVDRAVTVVHHRA